MRLDEILRLLWGRKLTIFFAALVGGAALFAASYALPRLYRSEAEIVIRGQTSVVPDPERVFNSAAVNDAVVRTEKDVLSATGLLSQVASRVTFPPGLDAPVSRSARFAAWLQRVAPARLLADWHLSPLLDGLADPDSPGALAELRLQAIERAIRLESDSGSSVVRIVATTGNPQFSADIANTLAGIYMKDRLAATSSVTRDTVAALHRRLDETEGQIAAAEQRTAHLLKQPGLLEESEVPGTLRELSLAGARLEAAKADLEARRATDRQVREVQASAGGDPVRLVEMLDEGGKTSAYLREQYLDRQQERAQLAVRFGPNYPGAVTVERQMDRLKAGFAAEARRLIRQRQAQLAAAEQTVAALSRQYAELQQRDSQRGTATLVLARARQQLDSLRGLANNINDRILALISQPIDPDARIVSDGIVPLRPVFPNKPLFAISGAVFASLCVVLLLLARAYRRSFRPSPAGGAQLLAGPFLGALPRVDSRLLAPNALLAAPRGKLVGSMAASFHGIALQIEDLVAREGIRVLTITSGRPNEGKSTVASLLAATLASFGSRVLLVDCDVHPGFSRRRSRRGVNWRKAADAALPVVIHEPSGIHVLELAKEMAEAPLYYLRSAAFRSIIERARAAYEIVLCDTPPVLAVPDPLLVAKYSDGVLLVAEHERLGDQAEAEEISRRIALSGKPICGVIVTKTAARDAGSSAYTGYENWRVA
jgi:uncharacterized protein involved in exopolysaccharide biosynthesis/Mrp family chromosome partitioning ATPase